MLRFSIRPSRYPSLESAPIPLAAQKAPYVAFDLRDETAHNANRNMF